MSAVPTLPSSSFLFTTCQVGAEPALKKELLGTHPELRFAYSRPGFVTFKCVEPGRELRADIELRSVFARSYGLSFGKAGPEQIGEITDFAGKLEKPMGKRRLRLHTWERDQHFPGDEPLGYIPNEWASAAEKALRSQSVSSELFEPTETAREGDLVFDVIAVEADQWWYGCHIHSAFHSPVPGAKPGIVLPDGAPSRAFVKLEEALLWSQAPVRKGDTAVEIGSAPGGASYALLQRGLRVIGIDPGEMDAGVLRNRDFRHIRKPVAQVPREDLPESVQWLLLDMNVEPAISLFAVDRLAARLSDSLLGMFLTVKLNRWKIAEEIPGMLEHVRAMGMTRARATQLASNRQEFVIYGLTRKGQMRK
jgi:23S rRNA (cytidine2498-2'-O)-methyltransferase